MGCMQPCLPLGELLSFFSDWNMRLDVPVWGRKVDHQDFSNYRGIKLPSVPDRVFVLSVAFTDL